MVFFSLSIFPTLGFVRSYNIIVLHDNIVINYAVSGSVTKLIMFIRLSIGRILKIDLT